MKTINFLFLLVLTCTFYACSNNDDNTKTLNPTENGFTFNSEFYATGELFLNFDPDNLYFFIIDNTSEFNSTTQKFEGNPEKVISIGVPSGKLTESTDLTATFTHAIDSSDGEIDEITDVSFVGVLLQNIASIETLLFGNGVSSNQTTLIANTGKVTVSYNSEKETFTLEYTFITIQGTITGYHEGKVIVI